MKRKIIKQGSQAFTLTLPINWIRENNLSEQNELELKQVGRSLIINAQSKPSGGSIKFDFNEEDERLLHILITSCYAQGIDEITITSKKDLTQTIVRSCNNTLGYTLIGQEKSSFIIRDISGTHESDLGEIFKRVFQVILLFFDSAVKDISTKTAETLDGLAVRDREVNKLCLYLQREINKHASEDSIHGRTLFTYSYALEKLSDEIERLWRTAIKTSAKPPKSFLEISALISQLLELSFDLYYHPNLKTVGEIRNLREKIREDALKNLSSFQRIAHHLTKIAEEASDMNHLALIRLATVRKN